MWEEVDNDYFSVLPANVNIHYNYVKTIPDTYTISNIQATDSGIELTVQTNDTNISGEQTVMVATYDELGVFIGLKQQQITASTAEQTVSVEIDKSKTSTVKAFIWNAMQYMMPASRSISLEL